MPEKADAGSWIAFGSAQTGQLDKANLDKTSAISIVQACEARDAAARQATIKRKGATL